MTWVMKQKKNPKIFRDGNNRELLVKLALCKTYDLYNDNGD